MVTLKKVRFGNIIKCARLKVAPEQKRFVASNKSSIWQAFLVNRRLLGKGSIARPYAIYADGKIVGFIMYAFFTKAFSEKHVAKRKEDYYYFWRFMIDKNQQGKGYARQALTLTLEEIRKKPYGEASYCYVSYEPENAVVRKWYQNLGFEETGELLAGELVARIRI